MSENVKPNSFEWTDELVKDFEYKPSMPVKKGVNNFVKWYREYHEV